MRIKRVVLLLRHKPHRAEDVVFQLKQDYEVDVEDSWWEISDEIPPYLSVSEADQMRAHRAGLDEQACFMTVWIRLE